MATSSGSGQVIGLGPNSVIYANERIVTEADGSVSIMLDGPPPSQIDLGRMSDVLLNEDVYAGVTPEVVKDAAAEAADAEKIQEALEGQGDIELDATAAGGAAGTGGQDVVRFNLDGSEVTPESGAETTGIGFDTVDTLEGVTAEEIDTVPIGGVDVAAVDEDGLGEDGIPGGPGDHPAEDSFITGNLTYSFGDDGPAAAEPFTWNIDGLYDMGVTSQGHALEYEIVEGVTLNAYYNVFYPQGEDTPVAEKVPVFSVTVTDVATGAYTFELYQPLDHAEPGTEDDIVYNFTYTLTDGDGSTGTGSLAMTIDDDMPVISAYGEDLSTLTLDESPIGGSGIIENPLDLAAHDFANAINLDGHFTLGPNADVGNSETVPFVSIHATGNSAYDYYSFTVTQDGSTAVFDIDYAAGHGGSFDSILKLYDGSGNNLVWQDDYSTSAGGGGSISGLDSYLTYTFAQHGTYYIAVGQYYDSPVPAGGTYQLQVSLTNAIMGGGGGDGDGIWTTTADYSGNFDFAYGADGPGGVSYALSLGSDGTGSGLYALEPTDTDSGMGEDGDGDGYGQGAEIVLSMDNGAIVGMLDQTEYFRITVDSETGVVTFTRYENIWHADVNNPDEIATLITEEGTILLTATVTDFDGDTATATLDLSSGVFAIEDDGPAILATSGEDVDETGGLDSVTGTLSFEYGTDGAGSIALSKDGATWDADNLKLSADDGSWEVVVNDDGTYTFTQLEAISHPDGEDSNDAVNIIFTATVTDADGDSVSQDITVVVYDDGPSVMITGGEDSVTEGYTVTDGTWEYTPGADGASVAITVDGVLGTYALNAPIDTGKGTLTVNDDGTWTFAAADAQAQPQSISFTVTVTDGDNDVASDDYTINILDDGTYPSVGPEAGTVYESALADGSGSDIGGVKIAEGVFDITLDGDALAKLEVGGVDVTAATMAVPITVVSNADYTLEVGKNIDGYYTWKYTLNDDMTHTKPTLDLALDQQFDIVVTDIDGDISSTAKLTVTIEDDEPAIGDPQDSILAIEQGNQLTAALDIDFGADGAAATLPIQVSGRTLNGFAIDDANEYLTSDGTKLVYQSDGNGGLIAYKEGTTTGPIFTVSVDSASGGTYTVHITGLLDGATTTYDVDLGSDHTGGNIYAPEFYSDVDNDGTFDFTVIATATIEDKNGNTIPETVNFNANSIGVGTGNAIDGKSGDILTLEFFDYGTSTHQELSSVTVDLSNFKGVGAYVTAYGSGGVVTLIDPNHLLSEGTTWTISASGDETFYKLEFSAESTSSYKIASISVTETSEGADHVVTYGVTATDGDLDQATDAFTVTFDGDGILDGRVAGIEVIKGSTGAETIYANDGSADYINSGGGIDTVHLDGPSLDTLIDPDVNDVTNIY